MPVISPGPVPGSTVLPVGFPHPHASEEARSIAEKGMILRVQVGSGVHGTSITGQDDRDEMGLCLEPPQFVTGLASVPDGTGGLAPRVSFEQYERHTAWDRPGGLANRSGAGDLDVIIYSARKWARLALAGNPTVLLVLFTPDEEVPVGRADPAAPHLPGHGAGVVEGDLLPVDIQPAYDGHRDLLKLQRGAGTRPHANCLRGP